MMRAEMYSILFSSLLKTLKSLFEDYSGVWTSKHGERYVILPVFCALQYENKWIKKQVYINNFVAVANWLKLLSSDNT